MLHFFLTQALVSSDLMENEGKNKEGKLVNDGVCDHIEIKLERKNLSFTIWSKPSKKKGTESAFCFITCFSNVYYDEKVTLHISLKKP